MTKRLLITGAAGFLGSYLTEHFVLHGAVVVGVDNFFRGKKENLTGVINHPHFTLIEIDLSAKNAASIVHTILVQHNIDTIIHLAAVNGTQYFYEKPYFVFDQNTRMTQQVLTAAKKTSVKKIIYSSSSEVYGDPHILPTPESEPILLYPDTDRDSYAASKAAGDFYVRLFCEKFNLDYLILRIFNLYGHRMIGTKYGQVIPEFAEKLRQDAPFTIIGNGSNTRSFCEIKDAITLIDQLIEKNQTGIVNLGNDHEISILDLAKLMHELVHKPFNPIFLPERPNDHLHRRPDISLLKTLVPDICFTPLKQGLSRLL